MTLQGLFGNGYSLNPGSSPRRMMASRSTTRVRPPGPAFARRALAPTVLFLFLGTAIGAAAGATPATPYSAATSGALEVTIPTEYPQVVLSTAGNASVNATLSIDQVLETTPTTPDPTVVAVALLSESDIQGPSGASPASPNGLPLYLSADLTVYPSDANLWAGPEGLVQPNGAPLGTAHLWANYSLAPGAPGNGGVAVSWTVTGWPYVSASDLLGVQMSLETPSAASATGCTHPGASVDEPGCAGGHSFPGGGGWAGGVVGVQQRMAGGSTALLNWSNVVGASGAAAAPTIGLYVPQPARGEIVLAAPASGAPRVAGSVDLSLLPPEPLSSIPALVKGDPWSYALGAGVSVSVGVGGLLAFRRRERSLDRTL